MSASVWWASQPQRSEERDASTSHRGPTATVVPPPLYTPLGNGLDSLISSFTCCNARMKVVVVGSSFSPHSGSTWLISLTVSSSATGARIIEIILKCTVIRSLCNLLEDDVE